MNLEERLLTKQDIEQIEEEAQDPIYRDPSMLNMAFRCNSIYRVSDKGVILIKGNEDTGFEHINQRHNALPQRSFWIKRKDDQGNETVKLDNPSKFSMQSIPIFEYIDIADHIFSDENKRLEDNKRPDLFDVYSGEYIHRDGLTMKYRLITYKDTKIIHTLIPLKKTFTREKVLDLCRGGSKGTHNLGIGSIEIEVPYLNHKDEVVCKLIFLINEASLKEEVFIEYPVGEVIHKIAQRDLTGPIQVPRYMTNLDYADLKDFEKTIKTVMAKENSTGRLRD